MNSELKSLTLLHLSDLHFGKFNQVNNHLPVLKIWFDKLKEKFVERRVFPDLILITGDISSEGKVEDFITARDFISEILNPLFDVPLIVVPGNHDLQWNENDEKKHYDRFENYLTFIQDINLAQKKIQTHQYFKHPHFYTTIPSLSTLIFGINSCLYCAHSDEEDYMKGYFKEECRNLVKIDDYPLLDCLNSLDKNALRSFTFKIAIMHHNLLTKDDVGLKNPDPVNFTSILNECYGFDIILHGHTHERRIVKLNDCLIVGAGSVGIKGKERSTLNDLNVITIEIADDFIKPYKKVFLQTFELNYQNYNDAIRVLERTEISPFLAQSPLYSGYIDNFDFDQAINKVLDLFEGYPIEVILLLSLVYISRTFTSASLEVMYDNFIGQLKLQTPLRFRKVYSYVSGDIIICNEQGQINYRSLASRKAFKRYLYDSKAGKEFIEKYFLDILLQLAEKPEFVIHVAEIIISHYDTFPSHVQQLLDRFAKHKKTRKDLAWAILFHFEKLSEKNRDKLLASYNSLILEALEKMDVNKELLTASETKKLLDNIVRYYYHRICDVCGKFKYTKGMVCKNGHFVCNACLYIGTTLRKNCPICAEPLR